LIGTEAPCATKWFRPRCCRGGANLKQFVAGGVPRSHFISAISTRVLCVKLQGSVVISFSLVDLLVIGHPPLD
jgi:hypothetical protein